MYPILRCIYQETKRRYYIGLTVSGEGCALKTKLSSLVADNPGVLMRLVEYDGVEHLLSERNWRQMLRRFDANRASLNVFGYYFISGKSICVNRDYKCIRCPLRDPRKKTNSCTYLFDKIIGEELLHSIHLRDSGILWDAKDDELARLALQKVVNVLSQAIHIKLKRKKPLESGTVS